MCFSSSCLALMSSERTAPSFERALTPPQLTAGASFDKMFHPSDISDRYDLDHLDPNLPWRRLCRICVVQIQPRKHVLDHAGYTAPTRQHELDHTDHTDHTNHTDHTDHTDQDYICPERYRSSSENRRSVRCEEWLVDRTNSSFRHSSGDRG